MKRTLVERSTRRLSGILGALVGSLLLVPGAWGAGGRLRWQDQLDPAGGFDFAQAVAVQGPRVFTAGDVTNASGNFDLTIRAYHAQSGALLWQDQVDMGANEFASDVLAHAGRVFVAGNGTSSAGGFDFLVRAYDAESGALLWQDQLDEAGGLDQAFALAAQGGRVFAAGNVLNAAGNSDFLVRAYDAETGALLWEDQFDAAGGNDGAGAIAEQGGRIFAAGNVGADASCQPGGLVTGNCDFAVRAYDAGTGTLLWQDRFDEAGAGDGADAVAAHGGRVFVAGAVGADASCSLAYSTGNCDLIVRAYDAAAGVLLWEDQIDEAGGQDRGFAVAAHGDRAVVAGSVGADASCDLGGADPGNCDFLVRAYDAASGAVVWTDRFDAAQATDAAFTVALRGNRVFAGGLAGADGSCKPGLFAGNCDFLVRAYDAGSGALSWQDQFDRGGGDDVAYALAVRAGRVFAVGQSAGADGNVDYLVRAYDAH